MPPYARYADMHPDQLEALRTEVPVVYMPWGALEWHGPHLPLGTDGLVAEAVAERCARRTGGVLLPTTWWPAAPLPHRQSLAVNSATLRELWDQAFAGLAAGGWCVAVVLSGNYAHGHELVLMEVAEDAASKHNLLVLALPPLAMVDEEMLDHAGLWEVSLLLALRPELVDMRALGTGPLGVAASGVLGADPRGAASSSLGEKALALAIERITGAVHELLVKGDPAPLHAFYQRRRSRYRSYVETYYRGSLEEAALAWWQERVREDQKAVGGESSREGTALP